MYKDVISTLLLNAVDKMKFENFKSREIQIDFKNFKLINAVKKIDL